MSVAAITGSPTVAGVPGPESKTRRSSWIASLLLLAAFVYAQPNILSAQSLTPSIFLAGMSSIVVLLVDRGRAKWLGSSAAVIVFLFLASLWQLARSVPLGKDYGPIALGSLALGVMLVSAALLISNPERTRVFAQLLIVVFVGLSASSIVTAAIAAVGAVIEVGTFPLDTITGRLLFPFTPTSSSQTAFGIVFPRFIGIGREPGWMGMYAAAAWFMVPFVFGRKRTVILFRLILAAGVITTFSTAGFAVFVIALSVHFVSWVGKVSDAALRLLSRVLAMGVILAALGIAWTAPFIGLADKPTQNAESSEERTRLTEQGWNALQTMTLGEPSTEQNAGISVLSSVVELGWPYFVLIMAAILVPMLITRNRGSALAPVSVIGATLLLFQPPAGASGAYLIVMLACALASQGNPRR